MANGIVLTGTAATIPLESTGLRRDVAEQVKDNIRQLLVDILCDKLGHAMAIAVGPVNWREAFNREMAAFFGNNRGKCDEFADDAFRFLRSAWDQHYPLTTPQFFLDKVHIESPKSERETEQEIEDAWEIEIASDDASMSRHYHGSARVRKGRDAFSTFWNKSRDSMLADLKKTN